MTEADPNLLSLLEKISNPLNEVDLTINLKGIYAPSQQWKLTDEANPNLFTYSLEVMNYIFTAGKIEPRKLTEKQIKEQQQLKNKKASKKEAKQEQKVVIDPQAEKKRLQFQALPQEQKFYLTQQDPFKAFSLLWADNQKINKLQLSKIEQLENSVNQGYLDIFLIRKPEGNEEDIAKIKKAKPKGLNLGELYAAKYKGRLNLSELSKPGQTKLIQRVPLTFSGDIPAQCIKIDVDKCYALIQIQLSNPLNPLVIQATPLSSDLLGEKVEPAQKVNLLWKLAEQIKKGVKAISQQYTSFFAKQKQHADQKKFNSINSASILNVSTLRINEINKRKQQFLQQFVNSGKYGILCERINKTIRAIVIDKIRKEKTSNNISKQAVQRTLAELNVFFRDLLQKTLDEYLNAQVGHVHQDLVLNHQFSRSSRKQVLAGVIQSKQESEIRLANEYEIINKIDKAQEKYINLTLINNSLQSLQNYAKFCLRNNHYQKAFALYTLINKNSKQFKHGFIIVLLKLHRKRQKQALSQLIRLQNVQNLSSQEKILINLTYALIYESMGEQKKSQKHIALAQKHFQRKNNPNIPINPPKNPYIDPIPRIPKPGRYISQLTTQESQQIRLSLMNYFIDYNFFSIARSYLNKISQGQRKRYLQALILVGQNNYEDALMLVESLLEKDPKNLEILLLKSQICFKSEKMFEIEEVLLYIKNLKLTPNQYYSTYLRLGLTYLNRKSWQDAKDTFNKAVELKPNSSVAWLGLGIANLQLNSLKQSYSIYNPLSEEPKNYLKIINDKIGELNLQNYKYLQKEIK